MEIKNSIQAPIVTTKQHLPTTNSTKAGKDVTFSATILPSIHSSGTSMVNSNLPISYTKIGEMEIPGLKEKASVFKLANGQKVIIAPKKGPTMVKTAYNVGANNEPDNIRGISHFIEHNLFNGSKNLAPREYSQIVSQLGGQTNANTGYSITNYFLTLQHLNENSLEEAIKLNSQQTQFPTFPLEQLEKEKEPVKSEIDMYEDVPTQIITDKVIKDLFNIQTTSNIVVAGTKNNINALTRETVMDYYNTWYTPDNAVTVITGDVDVNETISLVSKYYNKQNDYSQINNRYYEPIQYNSNPKRQDIIMPNATSADIVMGFAIPDGTTKEDIDKLEILIELLSSPTRNLYKKFDKNGVILEFNQERVQNKPNGARVLTCSANTTEENIESTLKTLYEEITNIANNPPSQEELEIIKKQRIKELNSISESSLNLNNILSDAALENNYDFWGSTTRNIQNITPQDISNTAKKFLDLNKVAICVSHEKSTTPEQIQNNYNTSQKSAPNISFGAKVSPQKVIAEETEKVKKYRLSNNIETTIIPGNEFAKSIITIDFATDELNFVPSGTFSVLNRLLNRGSLIRNNDTYNNVKTQNDIKLNFYAGLKGISINANYNDENMQDTLSLIKESLLYPNFTQEEFEQAKKIIKEEILYAPVSEKEKLYQELFPSIKLFESKEKQLQELDNLTLSDIQILYSHILSTAKVHASLAADVVQKPQLQDIFHNELSQGLGNYKSYTLDHSSSHYVYKPNTEAKILTTVDERAQAEITQAYTFPQTKNINDIAKINALNTILGCGMSSRLFKDLRENQKLAYSVGSNYFSIKDTGIISLHIGTTTESPDPKEGSPANITKSLEGFNRNVNLLKTENISEKELQDVKAKIKTEILNGLESNAGKVYSFTDNKDSVYDTNYCIELYNAIEKLTADDIRAAANYIFKNPPITSIVANQRTFDELKLH